MQSVKRILVAMICLLFTGYGQDYAQAGYGETRGELLYTTYCIACHDTKIHWREQRLAKDWRSLKVEVARWQHNMGLGWSESEIIDVARYLNTVYYHFPVIEKKEMTGPD